MKRKVSQWGYDKPKWLLVVLITAIAFIFLEVFQYLYIDIFFVFLVLFFVTLGIMVSLPEAKWTIQNIEICLKEGKPLSIKNVRAAKYGKKSANYLFIILGLGLTIFVLGLLFPELYLGDISVPCEMSPLFTPFTRASNAFIVYLVGVLIGQNMPVYLRVRKLPK